MVTWHAAMGVKFPTWAQRAHKRALPAAMVILALYQTRSSGRRNAFLYGAEAVPRGAAMAMASPSSSSGHQWLAGHLPPTMKPELGATGAQGTEAASLSVHGALCTPQSSSLMAVRVDQPPCDGSEVSETKCTPVWLRQRNTVTLIMVICAAALLAGGLACLVVFMHPNHDDTHGGREERRHD